MSRRPNAGGGRKNQNQANVPARARFSNWKPPSKALAHKFERQLREEEVVPPPPKPTATFGFSVPLSSNSRSGSSDSSRKDSREASALPVKSSFTLPPKCDPTQISNLTVSPSLLRQLVRMLGLEVIVEPARVMQPVPITPCEDFALKPVGKDTDQSVTEMASQSLPSTKRDKSSTAQSPYNLSDSTVPSTIHPKLEKLLNLFSSVGFTRDEVSSTLLHRTVPSTISKVSCDDKLNSNWEGADSVLVALLLAFHGVDWPAAAPEDSSLIEECEDMLNEELLSLQSIYGEKEFSFKKVSVDGQKCCRVTVQLAGNLVVVIYLLNTVHYPVQNWDVLAWVYCLDSVVVDNVASRSGTSSNRRFRNVSKSATSIVRSRLSAGSPILFETVQEFIDQSRSVTLNVESEEALESASVSASKSKRIANANVSAKSVLSTQATSGQSPMPMLLPAPPPDRIIAPTASSVVSISDPASASVKAVSLPIATPSPVAGYGLHKQRQRLVDTAEYRQCLLRALNAGLKDEEARSQAVVYLREIMPDSFIEAVLREQEVEEAIRNSAFKFSSLSFGGELEAIRLLMKLTGETKPKARAMLQLSKERMSEEGKNSARNEEVMVRKWVEESLVCMREREEKKKEKKEKKAISQKSVGPEEEKKEGRGGRRGPKRGLTIRDAFELRELVGRESEEGATGPAGEAADEEEPEDADADSDDSSDDREVTAVDKGLFSLEQCVATLKLKSQERSKEFPSSALSIDDEEASLREERLQRIQDAKTKKWQEEESNRLSSDYEAFKQQRFGRGGGSLSYETIMSQREQLPAYINRDRILDVISASRVVVISGDTGCGKTTQVPQLVLDQFIAEGQGGRVNIIVTQPRRICAVSVAERIAEQRGERVGKTVGFHIRLESKKSKHSRIVLMTTGVLLRMLQLQDNLSGVTHVFVDEVHERDMNTDFLLIVLKELMTKRPDLKIILMSATLKADLFQKYFKTEGCQLVNIPGRTFPVTTYYLEQALALSGFRMSPKSPCVYRSNSKPSNGRVENEKGKASERQTHVQNIHRLLTGKYDHEIIASLTLVDESILNKELILAMVLCIVSGNLNGSDPSKADVSRKGGGARPPAIADDGAILIFVDGFSSIKDVVDCLKSHPSLQNNQDFWILPLHSSLSTAEQRKVFKIPPRGVRKIIVCTNIAETSVTIEDVVFVIDTCRVKENRYDEASQVSVLEDCYISSANASQRRGRAGRVRPGVCFHLVSSVTFATFSAYSVPEMLRLSLEEVILQILALDLGNPHTFLSKALSPPSRSAINQALTYLESLSAVRVDDCSPGSRRSSDVVEATITPLGFHLAALPINPRIGKLILYATLLGCVSPVITIAAALSTKSPFSAGFDDRDEMDTAKQLLSVGDSDLLTVLNAYNSWRSIISPGNSSKLRSAEGDFCSRNCLSLATLQLIEQMRGQFLALLVDIGFLGPDVSIYNVDQSRENRNGNNLMMIKAVLCAGLVPNVLRIPVPPPTTRANLTSTSQSQSQSPSIPFTAARGKKEPEIETTSIMLPKTLGECQLKGAGFEGPILMSIHPSSVLFTRKTLDSQFILYLEAMRTSKLYGKEVSTVHPLLLTLFAAHCNVYVDNGIIVLENWIVFKAKKEFCQAINKIRKIFESAFIERVLDPLAGESDNWTLAVALVELIVEEINVGNVSHLGRLEERVNPQPQLASGRGGRLQSASSEAETARSQSSSSSSSSANNSGRNAGATSGFGISKGNGKIVTADTSDPKPYANSSIGLNAEIATARSNDISAAAAAVATGGGAGGGAGRGRGRGGGRDVAGGRGEDGRGGRGRGEDGKGGRGTGEDGKGGRGRGEDGRGGRGGRGGGSGKVVGGRGGAGDGR